MASEKLEDAIRSFELALRIDQKIENAHARTFYEAEALRGGWTNRQLDRQIQSQFYERTALSRNKAAMLRKGHGAKADDAVTAEEGIKDPFVLEFLDLKDEYSERDALVAHECVGDQPSA